MISNYKSVLYGLMLLLLVPGCHDKNANISTGDSPVSGTIHISVDESFRPVMEAQIQMYESSFPGTHIIAAYKTEADCLKDFFRDSLTRMVIITRGLSEKEDKYLFDSIGITPGGMRLQKMPLP